MVSTEIHISTCSEDHKVPRLAEADNFFVGFDNDGSPSPKCVVNYYVNSKFRVVHWKYLYYDIFIIHARFVLFSFDM